MDDRSDADDWKVFQFTENLKDNRNTSGYTKRRQNKLVLVKIWHSPTILWIVL